MSAIEDENLDLFALQHELALLRERIRQQNERIHQLEQMLTEHTRMESWLRALVDSQTAYLVRVDLQGNYSFTNRAFLETFGGGTSTLIGVRACHVVEEDVEKATQAGKDCLQTPGTPVAVTLRRRLGDGTVRWVDWEIVAMPNADNTALEFQCVGFDVTERYQMEEALRRSEETYRTMAKHFPNGAVALFDRELRFTLAEGAGLSPAGLKAEDFVGKHIHEIDLLKKAPVDDPALLSVLDGNEIAVEVPYAGGIHRIIVAPIRQPDGEVVGGVVMSQDVTSQKQLETELKRQNELLKQGERVAHFGTWWIDVRAQTLTWSDELYQLHGLDPLTERVTIETAYQYLTDEGHEKLGKCIAEAYPDGEIEVILRMANGELRDGLIRLNVVRDSDGSPLQIFAATQDITERKRAEAALRASQERYRIITELISDYAYSILVGEAGELEHEWLTEDSFTRVTGYKYTELDLQMNRQPLYHPDDRPRAEADMEQVLKGVPRDGEYRLITKSGEIRWVHIHRLPIWDEALGRVVRVYGVAQDITARRQAEFVTARTVQRLAGLHTIDRAIAYSKNVAEIAEGALHYLRELIGCARASFSRYNAVTAQWEVIARLSIPDTKFALGTIIPMSDVVGSQIDLEHTSVSDDLLQDTSSSPIVAWARANGIRSVLTVPMIVSGERIGILILTDFSPHFFTDEHVEIAEAAADQMAIAIQQAQMNAQIQQHTRELEQRVVERTAALQQSLGFQQAILNSANSIIITTGLDGVITSFNAAAECLLGYRADDLIGKHTPFMFLDSDELRQRAEAMSREAGTPLPDDPMRLNKYLLENLAKLALVRSRPEYEWTMIHRDGSRFPVLIEFTVIRSQDDQPIGLLGIATDIRERKQAQQALQATEERFSNLVATMNGGSAIIDFDFRLTYVNERLCELMGYTREELLGTNVIDYLAEPEKLDILKPEFRWAVERKSATRETIVRRKDGQLLYLLVSASPVIDAQGNITGSFAVGFDITARKQMEDALREALQREKELGELKSRFVSVASHELRTPLATIQATTETLQAYRARLDDAQIDKRLTKIVSQVNHLKMILEDILQLERIRQGRLDFNPVGLAVDDLFRDIIDEFVSHPDANHKLFYRCGCPALTVWADARLIRQIFTNLLTNAIKYSAENTQIWIDLDCTDSEVVLKVRDEGIGIPEADQKRIFEAFHRGSNANTISGTGLGLAITRECVELHGGKIEFQSVVNEGTTFTITFPRKTAFAHRDGANASDNAQIR